MTTIVINESSQQAKHLISYIRTLPFAQIREENKKVSSPCQYTVEELREQIDLSMDDYSAGRVVTMEQMRAKHPRP